jgi:hypothetical protein
VQLPIIHLCNTLWYSNFLFKFFPAILNCQHYFL